MELRERVERVEPVHVDDRRVDAQLRSEAASSQGKTEHAERRRAIRNMRKRIHLQALAHVLDEVGGLLAVGELLVGVEAAHSARRLGELFAREIPSLLRVGLPAAARSAGSGGRGGGRRRGEAAGGRRGAPRGPRRRRRARSPERAACGHRRPPTRARNREREFLLRRSLANARLFPTIFYVKKYSLYQYI